MSSGSVAIPLLKAAPEPDQIEDRLAGGPWRGLELCLAGAHVRDDETIERAIAVVKDLVPAETAMTAEAPLSWPSGAFVSVDRLDDEARAGIEASAEFAANVGSPVLTIHLFIPTDATAFRAAKLVDTAAVERFLAIGFTIDTSHAALFRSFAAVYPSLFGLASDDELALERYAEELGPDAEVAHVSDAHGLLGEGLPYGDGELDLDPVVRRLARHVRFLVAEIVEPDPVRSPAMKAGYRRIEPP